jgi:hypothetical protein
MVCSWCSACRARCVQPYASVGEVQFALSSFECIVCLFNDVVIQLLQQPQQQQQQRQQQQQAPKTAVATPVQEPVAAAVSKCNDSKLKYPLSTSATSLVKLSLDEVTREKLTFVRVLDCDSAEVSILFKQLKCR